MDGIGFRRTSHGSIVTRQVPSLDEDEPWVKSRYRIPGYSCPTCFSWRWGSTRSFFLTHRDHEDRPGILRLRTRRLLVGRHEPTGLQLPAPRLLATRQVAAVTLPILKRRRQPIRRQRRERRVLADPTQHLGERLRGHGARPRRGQLLFGLSHEDRVAAGSASSRACCSAVRTGAGPAFAGDGAGDETALGVEPAGVTGIAGRASRGPTSAGGGR